MQTVVYDSSTQKTSAPKQAANSSALSAGPKPTDDQSMLLLSEQIEKSNRKASEKKERGRRASKKARRSKAKGLD